MCNRTNIVISQICFASLLLQQNKGKSSVKFVLLHSYYSKTKVKRVSNGAVYILAQLGKFGVNGSLNNATLTCMVNQVAIDCNTHFL
jgi:hypothetical protein